MAEKFGVDSDLYNEVVILPENIRKELLAWFRGSKEVNIFITGRTGAGKSSLVNGLIGDQLEVAKEGDELDPATSKTSSYVKKVHDVKVTVWDSPGLRDGTGNEAQFLEDMKKNCEDVDLCVYCVNSQETRFIDGCDDIVAMQKLTETFGKGMWENALFVLTFANLIEDTDRAFLRVEDGQKPELFQSKLDMWKKNLNAALIQNVGIDREVANRVDVVPAGYYTNPALLDRDHWLSPVWFAALYAMKQRAQPAMIKLNLHRITENPDEIRDEDLNKFLHEQPLIFSKRGAQVGEKYGVSHVGRAIGLRMGEKTSDECKDVIVSEIMNNLHTFLTALLALIKDVVSESCL